MANFFKKLLIGSFFKKNLFILFKSICVCGLSVSL